MMDKVDKVLLNHQRKALGILCGSLAPLALIFGLFGLDVNPDEWWYSISATYYANSRVLLIGLLFSTFVYFLSYEGHDTRDRVITDISAISSLMVAVFPCETCCSPETTGLFDLPTDVSHVVHCCAASVLFISFAVMILVQFTQSGGSMTDQKRKRNVLYRICGYVIIGFMALQVATTVFDSVFAGWWTIINESMMLMAFSVAWLCKAGCFGKLNDVEE